MASDERDDGPWERVGKAFIAQDNKRTQECREWLERRGLHVVDAKQWAVLEAMRVADFTWEGHFTDERAECEAGWAELARREAKGG